MKKLGTPITRYILSAALCALCAMGMIITIITAAAGEASGLERFRWPLGMALGFAVFGIAVYRFRRACGAAVEAILLSAAMNSACSAAAGKGVSRNDVVY